MDGEIVSLSAYPLRGGDITAEFLERAPYTTFIAAVNQWNVPPGAYDTLSRWRVFGGVTDSSTLLEIACSTGFSSRELARLSGCRAHGIDLSRPSVEMAEYNRRRYGPQEDLSYDVADAMSEPAVGSFSHIVIGAAGKFFDDETALARRCVDLLADGGKVLASPFYARSEVPPDLVEHCREVFEIEVTTQSYDEVLESYRGFEFLYEQRMQPRPEPDDELAHYVDSTIERFADAAGIEDSEALEIARRRLRRIRDATNRLRRHQDYTVLVLGYREEVYPARFAERF